MRFVALAAIACTSVTAGDAGWSTAARLPEPLQELTAAVLKGRIYVAGGINAGNEAHALAPEAPFKGERRLLRHRCWLHASRLLPGVSICLIPLTFDRDG